VGAPIAPFRGTRGLTSRSRSDRSRASSKVPFSSSSSFSTRFARGQVCRCLPAHYPWDVITLRDDIVWYYINSTQQMIPCKVTRGNGAWGYKLFFHGRKRRVAECGMEEKRFLFPSRDTISRTLIRHITMDGLNWR